MDNEEEDALPLVARSLCKEAIEVATMLIAEEGDDSDPSADEANLAAIMSHVLGQITEVGIENFPMPDFDPYNIFTLPTNVLVMEEYFRSIGIPEDSVILDETANDGRQGYNKTQLALLLRYSVQMLQNSEDRIMCSEDDMDYGQVMAALDGSIHTVAKLVSLAKTINPGTEYVLAKVKRSKGGKISAEKRNERFSELKAMVLDEVGKHYSHLTGAKAARAVFEKWGANSKWFINEETNKPISEDPVALITRWITRSRSKPN